MYVDSRQTLQRAFTVLTSSSLWIACSAETPPPALGTGGASSLAGNGGAGAAGGSLTGVGGARGGEGGSGGTVGRAGSSASEAGRGLIGGAEGGSIAAGAAGRSSGGASSLAGGGAGGQFSDGNGGRAGGGNGGREAAGSSGRATDAGSAGAAGKAGALGSCSSGQFLLCEDFEGTDVGGIPSGWTRHGELVGVSDDAARRGSRSLKLRAAAAAERRISHDAGLLGDAHWGRIYYKVQQPVPDAFVHSTLVSFTGNAPMRGASDFRVVDTVKQAVNTPNVASLHQYLYNVQVIGGGEFAREGPYDQKFENVWHCVEYRIDAANQSYALYVDGQEELRFEDGAGNFARSDIPAVFERVRVGWMNYQQAAPGFTAWIDEVAFDDERIGCD